ncbi:MAG TPA: hypothetical protein VG125_15555 [Pirellulales bacterium]|nr:hypothetical protein [Pirellulales bacterium]
MERFARIVLGYHGAKAGEAAVYAKKLLIGEVSVEEWKPSENEYDWLGQGIYFWEHSPERARRWAGADGIVVGAVIQLGNCLDFTDLRYTSLLRQSHANVGRDYRSRNLTLPDNSGRDLKLRKLDCLVINSLSLAMPEDVHTVRGAFEEGDEAFPGAASKMETHIQIAVRNRQCILGIFRPTFDENEGEQ